MSLDTVKFYITKISDLFDIKGGVILGLFSLEILALIPYYAVLHLPFPETVRDVYLGVVAAFATTNAVKHYAESKKSGGPTQ